MLIRTFSVFFMVANLGCVSAAREPEMVRIGCGDGALIACENQPGGASCDPTFDHVPYTIALFDKVDGEIVTRLSDQGAGVPFEFLEEAGSWMRIRTCGREDVSEGWVNWDEGFSSRVRVRFE